MRARTKWIATTIVALVACSILTDWSTLSAADEVAKAVVAKAAVAKAAPTDGKSITPIGDSDSLVELRVYPPNVHLSRASDRQSILVQAVQQNGITRDVSDKATFTLGDESIAAVQGAKLTPIQGENAANGETELHVSYAGRSVKIPVHVENATAEPPISFKNDVMPVFMKAGCNQGSCHGAARGKDGFRLSLFGFDPEGDYDRLTREISGRRVNLAIPHDSLLIQKALGKVPHSGGERFNSDTEYYATLMQWLEAGAPKDSEEPPTG